MRKLIWPSLLLGGALALAGCGGTSSAGFSSDEDAYVPGGASHLTTGPTYGSPSYVSLPIKTRVAQEEDTNSDGFDNLEVVSPELKTRLAVLRVGSDRTDNHLLTVFTGLKNKTAHRLKIEVETIYKNKADQPLSAKSWVPITLAPHEETQYRSVAISEDATDFMVRIRHAPPTDNP